MSKTLEFKSDKFKKNRGCRSRWLILYCEKCGRRLAIYQKDGPGILKRLYIDRIIGLVNRASKNLSCQKCKTILGIRILYKKENRPAYRLFVGAIRKELFEAKAAAKAIK